MSLKFEKQPRRPAKVERARHDHDVSALSAMGHKGAEKAHRVLQERRAHEEEFDRYREERALKAAIEDWKRLHEATNEHVLPFNPDDAADSEAAN